MTGKTENMTLFKIKHIKSSKERYLFSQNITSKFLGLALLSSYKTTLKQHLNGEKWDVGYLSAFCCPVLLRWFVFLMSFYDLSFNIFFWFMFSIFTQTKQIIPHCPNALVMWSRGEGVGVGVWVGQNTTVCSVAYELKPIIKVWQFVISCIHHAA